MIVIRNVFRLKFGNPREAGVNQKIGVLVDSGYREPFAVVE